MDGSAGESSESGSIVSSSQSSINGALHGDDYGCPRQVSPIRTGGLRNTSPMGRVGLRNTSPSRQKVIKTRPRGLDEETVATFGKIAHPDVQMEDNIWAMLP
ncbi:hypothetical protein OIU84_014654 [Salix udensis]|uniref:Uncharacterized protein n=1 Tax=Salix udensis TaxID=889485 RepID=A0AAD6JCK6_9ROSI|nr:hypothetical protein OIU84_014654 [Salix udensis]